MGTSDRAGRGGPEQPVSAISSATATPDAQPESGVRVKKARHAEAIVIHRLIERFEQATASIEADSIRPFEGSMRIVRTVTEGRIDIFAFGDAALLSARGLGDDRHEDAGEDVLLSGGAAGVGGSSSELAHAPLKFIR
jgi:hypothetical protein